MENRLFDPEKDQKVRSANPEHKGLYVVDLKEYNDAKADGTVTLCVVNSDDVVIPNPHENVKNKFRVRKDELTPVGKSTKK